jgi:transposase InsO family protein
MRAEGFAVESICAVLSEHGCRIAARTYRALSGTGRRPVAARIMSDAVVIDALLATVGTPEGLYGRRKMTAFLRRQGLAVASCTVDRLMRDLGLSGVRRGRRVRTTIPGKDGQRAGDLLNRAFTAPAPNRVWIADFTYVRAWTGFVYVAFVVDVFAQRIIAWHASTSKTTDLVLTPVRMATWQRAHDGQPVTRGQLIHHHDAGSQYTALRFTEHLALEGIAPSIGTVGDAYDNCLMESIIGLYKTECVRRGPFHDGPLRTISDVEFATMAWVDWWNNRRLHSTIGMLTPAEHEAAHYAATAALQQELQPT